MTCLFKIFLVYFASLTVNLKAFLIFRTFMKTFPIHTEVRAALGGVDGDPVYVDGEVEGSVGSSFLCKWLLISWCVIRAEERS